MLPNQQVLQQPIFNSIHQARIFINTHPELHGSQIISDSELQESMQSEYPQERLKSITNSLFKLPEKRPLYRPKTTTIHAGRRRYDKDQDY